VEQRGNKMANLCGNWVEIRGDEEQVKAFVKLVGEGFNFNKIITTETDKSNEATEKWGCGSVAFEVDFEEQGDYEYGWYFWTKWNPPTLIYEKLCELFPDVFIYWRYEEPGMDLYGFLQNGDY
jgi:hypothetical protein